MAGMCNVLQHGLTFGAVLKFQKLAGLKKIQIMTLLRMSASAWARRKVAGRIKQAESERLLQAAQIFGMALQLYGGNEGGARVYMGTPNRKFLGETPLQMLQTDDAGAHQVEDLLFAQLRGDVLG
jgi:putative toxin-antitoxin system antitoxin component (TIGR02293 family)